MDIACYNGYVEVFVNGAKDRSLICDYTSDDWKGIRQWISRNKNCEIIVNSRGSRLQVADDTCYVLAVQDGEKVFELECDKGQLLLIALSAEMYMCGWENYIGGKDCRYIIEKVSTTKEAPW
jgi:hypothetical protein